MLRKALLRAVRSRRSRKAKCTVSAFCRASISPQAPVWQNGCTAFAGFPSLSLPWSASFCMDSAQGKWSMKLPPQEKDAQESGWTTKEVLSWPNAISMSRVVLGPALAWMVVEGHPGFAFCGMVIGGVTDWLDGYVARRMNIKSVLGSYLDPLADKVLVGSVAGSMAYVGLLHPALVGLMVARDVALVYGSFVYRARTLKWKWNGWADFFNINAGGAPRIQPMLISKVNTAVQLALICAALLEPALPGSKLDVAVWYLSWSVAATTLGSWTGYALLYYRNPDALASVLESRQQQPKQCSGASRGR